MTAGTVVITGGILATVILLCIIAVLCYCRLQVNTNILCCVGVFHHCQGETILFLLPLITVIVLKGFTGPVYCHHPNPAAPKNKKKRIRTYLIIKEETVTWNVEGY